MPTKLQYRNHLKNKILGLEDEGYGDFEYTDVEFDTYLELAVTRLYPALYQRKSVDGVTLATYGTNRYGSVTVPFPERVFLVEDTAELGAVYGWQVRAGKLTNIDFDSYTTLNIYYYDAYTLPVDENAETGIPAIYTPLIVLGALIEALESRHDTGVRPDPTAGHGEVTLLDRLMSRYERTRDELAMSLPAVTV